MSEFKVDDEVWYIGAEYGSGGEFDILMLTPNNLLGVHKTKIIEIYENGELGLSDFVDDMGPYGFYKSKNEAIDAMIKRLEEMRWNVN